MFLKADWGIEQGTLGELGLDRLTIRKPLILWLRAPVFGRSSRTSAKAAC